MPSRLGLVKMTDAELQAGSADYLEAGNLRASAACLRELQRRRGPLGLNPLGQADTAHR